MSDERITNLERDIRSYSEAVKILKDVYQESLGNDDAEPNLEQLTDAGVYLRRRISAMEFELEMSKNAEAKS